MLGVQEKHTLTEPCKPRRALSWEKGAQVAGTQPHRRENMPMGRATFYSLKTMPLSKQNSTMLVGMKIDTATRGDQYGGFLKKLKIGFPHDPAIPLLGTYPEKTVMQKDACTPMLTAAPFTSASMWKRPRHPSAEGWIKKMWYICTME